MALIQGGTHVFTKTRDGENDGTNDALWLVINVKGSDVVNSSFSHDSARATPVPGGGTHWNAVLSPGVESFESNDLDVSSVRVFTTGTNVWRPEHIFVFGDRYNGSLVPLACRLDVPVEFDASEPGKLSFPLRPLVDTEYATTQIDRLLVIVGTQDEPNYSKTKSPVRLDAVVNNVPVIGFDFPADASGFVFQTGRTNLYIAPVLTPFVRPPVASQFTARLTIGGDDQWNPSSVWIFGIPGQQLAPDRLIPLVAVPNFTRDLGTMSTGAGEGRRVTFLPENW